MKINKQIIPIVILGLTLVSTSCNKKGCTDNTATNYAADAEKDDASCTYAPFIKLNGQDIMTLSVGETYDEFGATAQNEDGSTAEVTVDNSEVDASKVGTYYVYYTASNENGTAEKIRTVDVQINQNTFIADWNCSSDCGTTKFPVNGNRTLVAGGAANEFVIDGMFTILGGQVTGKFSGQSVTIPSQAISVTGGTITVEGTGSINNTGTEFVVNYIYDNSIPLLGGSGSCTATYTKQ